MVTVHAVARTAEPDTQDFSSFMKLARRQFKMSAEVTVPIALRAGEIDGMMQAAGTRIALPDLPIGVTALELGRSVATIARRPRLILL